MIGDTKKHGMTQPYPPPGPGEGHPATPEAPRYGQGQPPYAQPPYGPPHGSGPKRNSLLPGLIVTTVLLVAAMGVLAFVLLRSNDTAADTSAVSESVQADEQLGDVDGNAVVPPASDGSGPELPSDVIDEGGRVYGHTLDKAAAFMDDVILGDWASATSYGGQEFQLHYDGDADLFAAEIAEATNGGTSATTPSTPPPTTRPSARTS
jgi:hypothetical protein